MTAVITPPAAEPEASRRRRRRPLVIVVAVLIVLAASGVGIGFWRYAATYSPLAEGELAGGYHEPGMANVRVATTDLGDELYIRGPAGTTAMWLSTVENDGSHEVTITGYQHSAPLVAGVQWAAGVYRDRGDGVGADLSLQAFPASVPAHGTIAVVVTLRQPACARGASEVMPDLPLYWSALGVHHEYDMPLDFGDGGAFVGCPQYLPHEH